MRIHSSLLLFALVGGLSLAVSTASANCGTCGAAGEHKTEKACEPGCDKPCCAKKEACAENCDKPCGAKKEGCEAGAAMAGCEKKDAAACPAGGAMASCPAGEGPKLVGEVVSVDLPNRTVVVKHEAIEGMMAAMTMGFTVPECCDISALKAGDHVEGMVLKAEKGYVLKGIKGHAAH
jgi:Cu/Ag efflux protein CusF